HGNAVVCGERDEEPCVAHLLEALQLDRLAHQRIGFERRGGGHSVGSHVLGRDGLLPEGKAAQARELLIAERRPLHLLGLVIDVRIEKELAEEAAVTGRPGGETLRLNICRNHGHVAAPYALPPSTRMPERAPRRESPASAWPATEPGRD